MPQEPRSVPVVGFNHNLTHNGRTFHVQTEDSGAAHAHVITHLYLGGNIMASAKASYTDLITRLAAGELSPAVRKLMEEQHKAMVRGLLSGQHDAEIARRVAGPIYEPGVLATGEKATSLVGGRIPTPIASRAATPIAQRPPTPGPSRSAKTPLGAPRQPLDERVLEYLLADIDGARR